MKQTYYNKVFKLNLAAKEEIRAKMLKNCVTKVDLREAYISVKSTVDGKDGYEDLTVTEVTLGSCGPDGKEPVCFDWEGGNSAWYYNPTIWCEIADAVNRILK